MENKFWTRLSKQKFCRNIFPTIENFINYFASTVDAKTLHLKSFNSSNSHKILLLFPSLSFYAPPLSCLFNIFLVFESIFEGDV